MSFLIRVINSKTQQRLSSLIRLARELTKAMVKIPKRGKPPFIKPEDVEDGDLATMIEPPYIQTADKSKLGKERTIITFKLQRPKKIYRHGLNNTSNDRLRDGYGEEGDLWKDKEIRFQKRLENVRGTDRYVLYVYPSIQQSIAPPEKPIGASATT